MSKDKKARVKEKKAFEDALRADRYDGVTRKVFADWLEENGYDDEAVLQRSWTPEKQQAEDWLVEYARECEMSYEELIEAANDYLDTGEAYCLPFDTPDIVYSGADEFWERFSLATGRGVSEDHRGETFFRCAC
jgi:uncharacterized protein (TIGR02996 family)